MKKVLYIDGCVLRETSRTEQLAQAYLRKILAPGECELETIVLEDAGLMPLDGASLQKRDRQIAGKDFSDAYFRFAKSFVSAEELVIAVPYWDMSFPSLLKLYLEHICICGLTFRYSETGQPVGLTKIQKAVYITTAGGYIGNANFGFDYVKVLLQRLFCISDVSFISAEGLDITGNAPQTIVDAAIRSVQQ